MIIDAVQCDACGAKKPVHISVHKGWFKVVWTDRVVSGVELDFCDKQAHLDLTAAQIATLARKRKEYP